MPRYRKTCRNVPRSDIEDPGDKLFGPSVGSPERDLLAAIIERAVVDLKGDDQEARRSAHLWIFREDHPAVARTFSFYWCMQALGWSACIPIFREKCREVVKLRAEIGPEEMIVPTSNFESIFKVEIREGRKRKEKA